MVVLMVVQRKSVVLLTCLMSAMLVSTRADAHADEDHDPVATVDKRAPKKWPKRFKGTGVRGRELASFGARHRLAIAQLQMRIVPALAVRGGAGIARIRPHGFLPEAKATAISAGLSVTVWRNHALQLDVDVNALRADYEAGALADTTVMLALKSH
jgi:hypothetical protein